MDTTELREQLCAAITRRSLVMFEYGDLIRVVEPHRFGINSAGHEMLSGWLRAGYSRSDPAGGWRNYLLSDVSALQVLDAPFAGTRPGYAAHDPRMREVYCELTPTGGDARRKAHSSCASRRPTRRARASERRSRSAARADLDEVAEPIVDSPPSESGARTGSRPRRSGADARRDRSAGGAVARLQHYATRRWSSAASAGERAKPAAALDLRAHRRRARAALRPRAAPPTAPRSARRARPRRTARAPRRTTRREASCSSTTGRLALAHEPSDRAVRLAERRALAHEVVGEVGRHHRARQRGAHALRTEACTRPSAPATAGSTSSRVSIASNSTRLSSCRSLL